MFIVEAILSVLLALGGSWLPLRLASLAGGVLLILFAIMIWQGSTRYGHRDTSLPAKRRLIGGVFLNICLNVGLIYLVAGSTFEAGLFRVYVAGVTISILGAALVLAVLPLSLDGFRWEATGEVDQRQRLIHLDRLRGLTHTGAAVAFAIIPYGAQIRFVLPYLRDALPPILLRKRPDAESRHPLCYAIRTPRGDSRQTH